MSAFEKQRERLVADIREAHQHYDLYLQIRSAVSVDSHREQMNKATNFWTLTLNAHLTSCRLGLCRIYDKTKGAITLNKWLHQHGTALLNKASEPDIVERHFMQAPVSESVFEKDLELTDSENPLVKTLNEQRNKAIIHSAKSEVSEIKSVFERHRLTYSDYEDLLNRADTILNRYSVLYSGESYSIFTKGRNDLETFLPDDN